MSAVLEFHNSHSTLLLAAGPSMVDQPGAAVQGVEGVWMSIQSLDGLLRMPLPPLGSTPGCGGFLCELRGPLVFYLDAWLAESIFTLTES